MQMSRFFYIKRRWKEDEVSIRRMSAHLAKTCGDGATVVLFPEGTDLNPGSVLNSEKFALKNNLKPLKRLLQPRTTGFSFLVEQLKQSKHFTHFLKVNINFSLYFILKVI